MNKRIEEVLDQVLGMEEFEHVDEFLDTAFVKKFAELIINECISRCYADDHSPSYEAAGRIAEHFEVK